MQHPRPGFRSAAFLSLLSLLLPAGSAVDLEAQAVAADTAGERLFIAKGCLGCHGASGRGGVGPDLARTDVAFGEFLDQVREPRERMPAFPARVVSRSEARSIYEFVRSVPAPPTRLGPEPPAGVQDSARCATCHRDLHPTVVRQFETSAMGRPGTQNARVDYAVRELNCAHCHGTGLLERGGAAVRRQLDPHLPERLHRLPYPASLQPAGSSQAGGVPDVSHGSGSSELRGVHLLEARRPLRDAGLELGLVEAAGPGSLRCSDLPVLPHALRRLGGPTHRQPRHVEEDHLGDGRPARRILEGLYEDGLIDPSHGRRAAGLLPGPRFTATELPTEFAQHWPAGLHYNVSAIEREYFDMFFFSNLKSYKGAFRGRQGHGSKDARDTRRSRRGRSRPKSAGFSFVLPASGGYTFRRIREHRSLPAEASPCS